MKYDLNEVREYGYLRLIVGVFNSCSKANALQNNKVSFDAKKVKLVIEDSGWKEKKYNGYQHFIFAHHSPNYSDEINYFIDKYECRKLFEVDNEKEKKAKEKCRDEFKVLFWAFLKELWKYLSDRELGVKDYNPWIGELSTVGKSENFKCLWNSWNQKEEAALFTGEIIQDMRMLYDIITNQSYIYTDEYIEKFLTEARNLFVTMYKDAKRFKSVYKYLCKDVNNVVVCAGHAHKAKQYPKTSLYPLSFIGHRFYDKKADAITFEVIVMKNDGGSQRDIHSFFINSWWNESKDELNKLKIKNHLILNS